MSTIRIVQRRMPVKGKQIPEQKCEYMKTPDGLPAMRVRWEGLLFGGKETVFVFACDALGVARVSDEAARFETRASGFSKGGNTGATLGGRAALSSGQSPFLLGLLGNLVAGVVGAAFTKTSGIKGFAVSFLNEKASKGYFMAVADPAVVEEILASVPQEKLRPDDDIML